MKKMPKPTTLTMIRYNLAERFILFKSERFGVIDPKTAR